TRCFLLRAKFRHHVSPRTKLVNHRHHGPGAFFKNQRSESGARCPRSQEETLPAELASREFFLETVAQVDIRPLLDHLVLQEEGSYLLSKASHLPQKPFIGGLTCRHINRIRRLVDHVLID